MTESDLGLQSDGWMSSAAKITHLNSISKLGISRKGVSSRVFTPFVIRALWVSRERVS